MSVLFAIDPTKYATVEELVEAQKKQAQSIMEGLFKRFASHSFTNSDDFRVVRNLVAMLGDNTCSMRLEATLFVEAAVISALKGMPFARAVSLVIADDIARKPEEMEELRKLFALAKDIDKHIAAAEAASATKQ